MKPLAVFLTVISVYLVTVDSALAKYRPYQPPTKSVSILVDKMVSKPITTSDTATVEFVDNLATGDVKFGAGGDVFFKIRVKNTSNVDLKNVTVKDFLPSYLKPIEGPGTFDKSTNLITISAGDFAVKEEKIYIIKARVLTADKLPDDITCITNKAEGFNDRVRDDDTAQLCIEKQVKGLTTTVKSTVITAKEIPSTGPKQWLLLYSISVLLGYAGLRLRQSS